MSRLQMTKDLLTFAANLHPLLVEKVEGQRTYIAALEAKLGAAESRIEMAERQVRDMAREIERLQRENNRLRSGPA